MKHIIKVETLLNLPETRPLIAMDRNKKFFIEGKKKEPVVPNNEFWYTTYNNLILTENKGSFKYNGEDNPIISHTHDGVKGIIKCENPIHEIGTGQDFSESNLLSILYSNSVHTLGGFGWTSVGKGDYPLTINPNIKYLKANMLSSTSFGEIPEEDEYEMTGTLIFNCLYDTFSEVIFDHVAFALSAIMEGIWNIIFNVNTVPQNYNPIESMLKRGGDNYPNLLGKTFKVTYNIFTNILSIHDLAVAFEDNFTLVHVYHLDKTPWEN